MPLVIRALLIVFWLPAALAAAPAPPTIHADTPLAEYAQHVTGKQFFGLYALGGKRGWLSEERRVKDYQGAPILETVTEMYMEISLLGVRSRTTGRLVTRYSLEGDGQILYIQDTEIEDDGKVERTAVREGEQLRIVTRTGDTVSERFVPLPRDTLKLARDRAAWLAAGPRKGDQFNAWETLLEEEDIDAPVNMEYVEPEPLVWAGVPVAASRVVMHVEGARLNALVGPAGEPLSGKYGVLFEFRAEEEAAARSRDVKPGNMLRAAGITLSSPIADPHAVEGLVLELSGLGTLRVPAGTNQKVRSQRRGRAVVEIRREAATPRHASLAEDERQSHLRATAAIQSDDPAIRQLASDIAGDATDPVAAATRIVEWINANLRRSHAVNGATATAVLAQQAGDGTEHALLFSTLARAAGIPTRQIGGLVHVAGDASLFGWHTWVEIHDGNGWVSVDPLLGQVRVDPTHLQLAVLDDEDAGNDAWVWLRAASELKIKVREVEREL